MKYKININNIYDSSNILFSIPVHENQQIINNQIENILNFNPNCKIILHINKSFKTFNPMLTSYKNVYINSRQFNYQYSKGLFLIHINNFYEAISLDINFSYFVILSSNEMFIRSGANLYINKVKNGSQIVKCSPDVDWHNFSRISVKEEGLEELLKELDFETFYGGQTEGQFYEKEYFQIMGQIYTQYFGNKELNNFETEEILPQTIFKSFNIEYGLPITLQNYTNDIIFTKKFIENIIYNINFVIPNNKIKGNLFSPHADKDTTSIFSIKRIERTFNELRDYLSQKGFILNKGTYQLNTYYYSNNSSLIFYNENHLLFSKKNVKIDTFNWFGYEIDKGYYQVNFEVKVNDNLLFFKNVGFKINSQENKIYNYFLKNIKVNEWIKVSFPIHILIKDTVLFTFDDYLGTINIEFKNILFKNTNINNLNNTNKENIAILLYDDINKNNKSSKVNYSINYNNIKDMILKPFAEEYNIFSFISLNNLTNINEIINYYQPNELSIVKNNKNINNIFIDNINKLNNFTKITDIVFDFVLIISLDSIFRDNIFDKNYDINKFNFLSYHIPYINNDISNSYNLLSFPNKYLNDLYQLFLNNINDKNICYSIYSNLKKIFDKDDFNFIYENNYNKYERTPLITYLSDISDKNEITNNKGYLFNKKYINNIFYSNQYSKITKNINSEFYFYKGKTKNEQLYQWIGLYINNYDDLNSKKEENIIVSFKIKLLNSIDKNKTIFGLKTHEPLKYYTDWIDECELNIYKEIELNINIYPINQYIIFNFDNYEDIIEFYIKDFKIKLNYT